MSILVFDSSTKIFDWAHCQRFFNRKTSVAHEMNNNLIASNVPIALSNSSINI